MDVFGELDDGRVVQRVHLTGHGLSANVMTWGAVLQDLRLDGFGHSLVLGFSEFAHYPARSPNFGAIVGRVANRIRNGEAKIGGRVYTFDKNVLDRHTLHGGGTGAGKRIWEVEETGADFVTLSQILPDGHMGFPGNMTVHATYRIVPGPVLEIEISAISDADTLCNFASQSYFNLDGGGDARRQFFQVDTDHFLTLDEDLVPTGEVASVEGTQFDFRSARPLLLGKAGLSGEAGYDNNLCLARHRTDCRQVARLKGAVSGIEMKIETTEPGLQIYDGSKIGARTEDVPGLNGAPYQAFSGIALEPQAWPDAPNQDWADQVRLAAGETYRQTTRFVFG